MPRYRIGRPTGEELRRYSYVGEIDSQGNRTVYCVNGNERRTLPHATSRSGDLYWGTIGGGSGELARSILADLLDPEDHKRLLVLYGRDGVDPISGQFKVEVIAHLPEGKNFILPAMNVVEWIESKVWPQLRDRDATNQ